jgi:glutaryl-CoA dehydrogenase
VKYLPKLATGEFMVAAGTGVVDPGSMITNFKDMGDHYLLNEQKMRIQITLCRYRRRLGKNEEGKNSLRLIEERGGSLLHQKRITNEQNFVHHRQEN